MKDSPKVFAVVLNYNGRHCLFEAIASLFQSDYPAFQVVLVDNGSTDGSFEMVKKSFSRVVCIKNENNLGYAAGNNVGIEYALERGAKYVWLLNNDTKVEKRAMSELVRLMEGDEAIGIASPLIFSGDSGKIWFSGGKISWWRMKTAHIRKNISRDYFGSDYLTGCAMMVRAKAFRDAGLLDEKYFLYLEDADFSRKVREAGYKLAVSSASRIKHFEKSESKPDLKIYWLVLSGLIFFKRHTPLYLLPWMNAYLLARKIKNKIDLKFRRDSIAEAVSKAYSDYKYAK